MLKEILEKIIEKSRIIFNSTRKKIEFCFSKLIDIIKKYREDFLVDKTTQSKRLAFIVGGIALCFMIILAFSFVKRAKSNLSHIKADKDQAQEQFLSVDDDKKPSDLIKSAPLSDQALPDDKDKARFNEVFSVINNVDNQALKNYYLYLQNEYYPQQPLEYTLFPKEVTEIYDKKKKFKALLKNYKLFRKQEDNIQRELNSLPN